MGQMRCAFGGRTSSNQRYPNLSARWYRHTCSANVVVIDASNVVSLANSIHKQYRGHSRSTSEAFRDLLTYHIQILKSSSTICVFDPPAQQTSDESGAYLRRRRQTQERRGLPFSALQSFSNSHIDLAKSVGCITVQAPLDADRCMANLHQHLKVSSHRLCRCYLVPDIACKLPCHIEWFACDLVCKAVQTYRLD